MLSAGTRSAVVGFALTVTGRSVPVGVPALTVIGTEKVSAVAPGVRFGPLQVIVLPTCAPQDQPAGVLIVPTVTLAGMVSTRVMIPESDGPWLLSV